MDGITYLERFLNNPADIFNILKTNVDWDERMAARKTASYGVSYNYSQISYPSIPLLPELQSVCVDIKNSIGFAPNNCLINYYVNGKSKMGFHSDQTDILEPDTGVAILSLGQSRVLRFRKIDDKNNQIDFQLLSGSLFYMTQEIQHNWVHAIPESQVDAERISLTFRKIKQ